MKNVNSEKWWKELSKEWQQLLLKNLHIQQALEKARAAGNYFREDYVMNPDMNTIGFIYKQVTGHNYKHPKTVPVEMIKAVTELKEIYLGASKLTDITPLGALEEVERISLWMNKDLQNIGVLGSMEKLRYIQLCQTNVSDLSPLSSLRELRQLNVPGIPASDISPLEKLVSLNKLSLHGTKVAGLESISALTGLTDLTVSRSKITSLDPLQKLVNLEKLWAYGCKIKNIEAVRGMSRLKEIEIASTKVTSIEPLFGLKQLQKVWIDAAVPAAEVEKFRSLQPECELRIS